MRGGYENYNRVFGIASFTGALRNHLGYVGGASKVDYLNAIAASFPEKSPSEHRKILADFWRDHQKMFLELFMYDRMTSENIGKLVKIAGRENLDKALEDGKGAILPVPHLGNVRLCHYALALSGIPMTVVSSEYAEDPEEVRRFKLSETSKVHEVGFRGQNPKWVLEALKNNRMIQIASTAEAGNAGVEVDFMKKKLFLTSGWVRFALLSKAPILPTYIIRNSDNTHTIQVESPFPLSAGNNRTERIRNTAQAFMTHLETIYRSHPHLIDWMSWHNRLWEAEEHFRKET